jgi:hypothetical protein
MAKKENDQCTEKCYMCDNRCRLPEGHPWDQMHNCGRDHSK